MLCRSAFEVNEMPTAEASLILTDQRRYDLLLVGYPLPDMNLQRFLSGVHGHGSPCADSPVLILSRKERLAETQAFVESGYVQALATNEDESKLQMVASKLLEVPPRIAARAMVRLEVALQRAKTVHLYQTRNISMTGMLISTERSLEIGTRMQAELFLPEDPRPVEAEMEVMRRSIPEVEGFPGLGLRFRSIAPAAAGRLQRYLDAQDPSSRPLDSQAN